MNPSNKPTLKQVAERLGVSTATVSNAFNRPDQLSAKLREHILSESAAMGYSGPNLAARSLRRGESGVIAVMLADSISYSFSDPVASQLLQGVSDVLAKEQKQLLLLSAEHESQQLSGAESLPDGFIFYGAPRGQSFQRILAANKPAVAVDFVQDKVSSVNVDNYAAARDIALHAMAQKPAQVAVLGMRIIPSDRVCRLVQDDLQGESTELARQRLDGYLAASEQLQVSLPPSQIWHIPVNTPALAEQAAREALTSSPQPQVLLCMSDVIALAAIRVARELGISVPGQLKVVGFDDIPEARYAHPSLTTVSQQSREKGRIAATLLLSGEPKHSHIQPTSLRLRASTGN